jgi:hypothetical protein
MSLWIRWLGPVELYMQQGLHPRAAFAARYQPGQLLGELEAVARRAGDFEMTEIPQWRCLQVRTGPGERRARSRHRADGRWLVSMSASVCRAR